MIQNTPEKTQLSGEHPHSHRKQKPAALIVINGTRDDRAY